jgi:hypothetical protein
MSGRNGRAVSVRKTEAIVSYQHTKKASILSRHTRDRGCFVSAVVLRRRSSPQPAGWWTTPKSTIPSKRFTCCSARFRHSGRNSLDSQAKIANLDVR